MLVRGDRAAQTTWVWYSSQVRTRSPWLLIASAGKALLVPAGSKASAGDADQFPFTERAVLSAIAPGNSCVLELAIAIWNISPGPATSVLLLMNV